MSGFYNEFLASLRKSGVSKVSHFSVLIPIPSVVTGARFSDITKTLSFRCEATELPGRQLVSQDIKIYGTQYKVPHNSLYQEITLTFLETGDLLVRDFFERWIGAIFQEGMNTLAYPDSYRVDMYMRPHSITIDKGAVIRNDAVSLGAVEGGEGGLPVLASWILVGAWPTAVNQMPVSWADDGLHRVTVTMAYQYYELFTSEGGPLVENTIVAATPRADDSDTFINGIKRRVSDGGMAAVEKVKSFTKGLF